MLTPYEAAGVLERCATRAEDLDPALEDFARWMDGSIEQNFLSQGRPKHWTPSQKNPTHTLVDKGDLIKSAHAVVEGGELLLVAGGDGQPPAKAPALQYGAKLRFKRQNGRFIAKSSRARKGVTRGTGTLDPRPYVLFQDEDLRYFGHELPDYVFSDPAAGGSVAA